MQSENVEPTNEQKEAMAERLQIFGGRLSKLATDNANKRTSIETRWLEDLRQFHGEYDEETKKSLTSGSKIYVNITRNKKSAAEARAQDMLFPTDDRNFAIAPTPVPELVDAEEGETISVNGQQVDKAEIAAQVGREARKKSAAMQAVIDDQLNEAKYNAKSRDVISDACLYGAGILKGPVVIGQTKRAWKTLDDGVSVLEVSEDLTPTVERVDPWDFFPDMSASSIEEAEFIFERRRLTKKQLRKFAKTPGILMNQLKQVLESGATESQQTKNYMNDIRAITGVDAVSDDSRYEMWEYHGPISREDLEVAGMEFDEDDVLTEYQGVVFFIGSHVIKATINSMDTEDQPYSVFHWEKDISSVFGFGIPYLMRNPQKVICASWRMMMDNGGMSVADQVVINRKAITPADGNWALGPKKVWYFDDAKRSISDVFGSFSTNSHQTELANIFSMARQLADEETNLPLIAQGEQSGNITKTSSGMSMLMNSANIVLRRAIKNWDDDVTDTLITRFYDWNMQFSNDPAIKGDFKVDARGSSALLVREKQQENLMILSNISAQNPHLAKRRDWAGLDGQLMKALQVPVDDVTLPDDKIKENEERERQSTPQDPAVVKAQMDAQLKQQQMQLDQQTAQMNFQLDQQRLQLDMQFKERELQQERELKLADIASRENITIEQLRTNTGLKQQQEQTKRDIAAATVTHKQTETQLKAANLAQGHDTYG